MCAAASLQITKKSIGGITSLTSVAFFLVINIQLKCREDDCTIKQQ